MGKIFNKKKKEEVVTASPPEAPETPGEIKEIEKLNNQDKVKEEVVDPTDTEVNYREIPVCMSRTQLDNMNIETNMLVKHIVSKIEEMDD